MIKAYFSRNVPFYLLGAEELTDSNGFDAYPVRVPEAALWEAQELRNITKTMEGIFESASAPEECAQQEANKVVELLGMEEAD